MRTLKDLARIIKGLKADGHEVEAFKGTLNNRKAFYIDGRLVTDYEIIRNLI